MAIYHLSVKPVQRSKGRSSTAAAAYRAACVIEDNRTGLKHDYTKKMGVTHTEIITPDGVDIPNRSDLWNMAERSERRKNSCTAREYEINLPYELDNQQRTELARDFCKQLAKIHGIAVDLCIHEPNEREIKAGADPRNHHAHILTTTRKITNEGLTDKADIEKAGRKRKEDLAATRSLWADTANRHFEMAGLAERIDSRSLKNQGSVLTPTIKMGKTATQMERQKISTIKGDVNRAITLHNELTILREQKNEQNFRECIGRAVGENEWADVLIRKTNKFIDGHEQQSISVNNLIRKCVSPTNRAVPNIYTDRARARARERKYFADEIVERSEYFDNETQQYRDRAADAAAALGKNVYPKFIGRQNSQDFDERQKNALNDFAHQNDLDSGDVRQQMRNAYTFFENLSISGNEKIINLLCDPVSERLEFEKTGDGIKNQQQQQPVPEPVQAVTVAAPNVAPSYRPRRP